MAASILLLLGTILGARSGQAPSLLAIHRLDGSHFETAAQWQFLAPRLENVDVVGLAEPIHMTHEFPILRIGIIRFLNEHLGFHTLALEGSLVDAWATQDRFLASARSDRDASEAQLALFPLWNTPEIRELFQYEAASWSTQNRLYVTSYDVQPGSGKGTYGVEAIRLLADRLTTYAAPPVNLARDTWLHDLQPLTGGCGAFTPADAPAAIHAIEQLETWIATASPVVAARFPDVPMHSRSLRLVPASLRGSLALCTGMASHSASYKALRDGQAAIFAEALRNVSIDRKLMLWAHWSHLTYDDSLAGPSVGYALRQRLGERIYTILPVADRGSAIMIFPAPGSDDDVGYGWVRAGSDQFATRMRALSSTPFLVDLRDASVRNDEAFAGSQTVWIESRPVRLSLIRNADAIVWLPQIGPPHVPLPLLMVLGGMHYRKTLAVLAVLLLVAGGSALVWRRRPRPARSSRAA